MDRLALSTFSSSYPPHRPTWLLTQWRPFKVQRLPHPHTQYPFVLLTARRIAACVSLLSATVTLTGVDLNPFANSSALGFVVVSPGPSSGQLYQTPDGLNLGAPISSFPTTVTNANFSVIYVSTPGSPPSQGGAMVLYQDFFQFQAQLTYQGVTVGPDQPNQPNNAVISITNSMVAFNGTSSWSYTSLNSSTSVLLQLSGSNLLGGSFSYVVQQLPLYVSHRVTCSSLHRSIRSCASPLVFVH